MMLARLWGCRHGQAPRSVKYSDDEWIDPVVAADALRASGGWTTSRKGRDSPEVEGEPRIAARAFKR
ncbi:hypothetical protein CCR82_09665 [Halochromatium salexigens]|uniref:Uncharacterized protein n=1 Tax=Halochromatium salexigens TaxID=49447 RepID=A0AAJ0XGH6_HALSE|nr:hypothetical protein [Halochromatium salexigens]